MELSQKPEARKPRIQYGPHRLRLSGFVARPVMPTEDLAPIIIIGDSEIVSSVVDIQQELIPLNDTK